VERSDMIKGYELTKGNFVELSREELKALEAVASDEISIEEFVPAAAVDPLFVERSYYLGAGKAGGRAYQLFRDALDEADLVAIASYAARGKQYIVELRAYETGLIMHQLRYPDEIKPWREVPAIAHVKTVPAELALARQVIDHLRRETFNPARYKDEVKARVRALIATKAKGGEITAPPSVERPAIVDLMAALKASLGAAPAHSRNGKRAAPATAAKHAPHAPAHGRRRAAGSPSTRSHANTKRKASPRRRAAHR
jgi:DNA end-binding protein Ku